jgi:hypothetical protein
VPQNGLKIKALFYFAVVCLLHQQPFGGVLSARKQILHAQRFRPVSGAMTANSILDGPLGPDHYISI